jgi:hypothetical protein
MPWMMVNVPMMIVFLALWVGIPVWLVLRHPDRKRTISAAPAVRNLPVARAEADRDYRRVA